MGNVLPDPAPLGVQGRLLEWCHEAHDWSATAASPAAAWTATTWRCWWPSSAAGPSRVLHRPPSSTWMPTAAPVPDRRLQSPW